MTFRYLQEMGLGARQTETFERFRDLLLEGNKRFNLTAIIEPEEVEIKHFVDSLLLRENRLWQESFADVDRKVRVADVGGGAGFPGIALKICDEHMAMDVLEASMKKVRFLQELAAALELSDIQALHKRAEEAGRDPGCREGYDWVLARGVAHAPVLLEYCLPLVKTGGYMAAYKGLAGLREAEEGRKAAALLGGELVEMMRKSLPAGMGERCILVYRKTSVTPEKYPRPPGMPAKKPLV